MDEGDVSRDEQGCSGGQIKHNLSLAPPVGEQNKNIDFVLDRLGLTYV